MRFNSMLGSPPQVRGKRYEPATEEEDKGITPAGAGKTQITLSILSSKQDHPRRCGENQSPTLRPRGFGGSPPQVRGKLVRCHCKQRVSGITPAGAGKTECPASAVLMT